MLFSKKLTSPLVTVITLDSTPSQGRNSLNRTPHSPSNYVAPEWPLNREKLDRREGQLKDIVTDGNNMVTQLERQWNRGCEHSLQETR